MSKTGNIVAGIIAATIGTVAGVAVLNYIPTKKKRLYSRNGE